MAIFGTIGLMRRFTDLSSSALASFRGVLGALFLVVLVTVTRRGIDWAAFRVHWKLLTLSGVLLALNWMWLFDAYMYTTVARATLAYYMSPIVIVLAAPFIAHDRLTPRKILCVVTSLVGMAFILGVFGAPAADVPDNGRGIFLALLAACGDAGVILANVKLGSVEPYTKAISQLFLGGAILLPYVVATGGFAITQATLQPASIASIMLLIIVHTGIAYAMFFDAVSFLPPSLTAALAYIDPLIATAISVIVLHEPLGVSGAIGAALILGSTLVATLPPRHARR